MNKRGICRKAALLLLVGFCSLTTQAKEFLVLGSFQQEINARLEGERIAAVSGYDVLMQANTANGSSSYRIVSPVAAGETERALQRPMLEEAGVTGIWRLFLDDVSALEPLVSDFAYEMEAADEPVETPALIEEDPLPPLEEYETAPLTEQELADIDALLNETSDYDSAEQLVMSGGAYLVAGAYALEENAMAASMKLGELSARANVAPAYVDGVPLYRVLIGPYTPSEESSLKAALAARGITGAWTIQDDTVVAVMPTIESIPVPQQRPQSLPEREDPDIEYESDFNLARLRRLPSE